LKSKVILLTRKAILLAIKPYVQHKHLAGIKPWSEIATSIASDRYKVFETDPIGFTPKYVRVDL
jgi:hypothetical protein